MEQILSHARSASMPSRLRSGSVKMLLLSHSQITNMHLWPSSEVNGKHPVRSEQTVFLIFSAEQMKAKTLFVFMSVFAGNRSSVASHALGSVTGVGSGAWVLVGSEFCVAVCACSGKLVTPVGDPGRSMPSCLCAFAKNNCRCAASFSFCFAVAFNLFDALRMGTPSSAVACSCTSQFVSKSLNPSNCDARIRIQSGSSDYQSSREVYRQKAAGV